MSQKNVSPLTEATFYILVSLLEPLHGYGIMQKVEGLSNGRVKLGPGTLYGALNNLQKMGLIFPVSDSTQSNRRKEYRITEDGKATIRNEIARLEEMICNGKKLLAEGVEEHE